MSIAFEPITPPLFPMRRFTVEEYHRLGKAGILTEDDAVDLLDGFIALKRIHTPRHDAVVGMVEQALRRRLPAGWMLRIQSAIATATSEPEPDIAVVRGQARDYLQRHPAGADIARIVEAPDSSLERDRAKARIYAAAGVPVYWIVNLVDECVEVYARPDAGAAARRSNHLRPRSGSPAYGRQCAGDDPRRQRSASLEALSIPTRSVSEDSPRLRFGLGCSVLKRPLS